MNLPELGAVVRLYPAPRSDVEPEAGKPLPLRRVQDGSGNFGRFLPEDGGNRPFDYYWHDRLMAGDVLLTDPRAHFTRAVVAQNSAPAAVPASPIAVPKPAKE